MLDALRLLIIEDSEDDAFLLLRHVERAYRVESQRVFTPEALEEALAQPWDIAISDWAMPRLNGLEAFHIARKQIVDLPFIIVSGTIGEDLAVDALKAGVDDFMSKGNFARLLPAIERARREAATRRRQRLADAELEARRQDVERSERLLRVVLDTVPDGVLVADADRKIIAINSAARRLLGLEATDTNLDDVDDRCVLLMADKVTPLPREQRPLRIALEGRVAEPREVSLQRKGGGELVSLSSGARPLGEESGIAGGVATFRDLTQEKSTQEQLMVSDRMASVGMLAAGVAHEINNPLAAVLANLDMVASSLAASQTITPRDLDEVRDMIADARAAGDRVRNIVRDLKIFSRHEEPAHGAVDVVDLLESTLRMCWNEVRHRARLVKELERVPRVDGSASRLGQVFLNLVINAAQAIPDGSAARNTIRVATRVRDGGKVVVEIADTGSGMSPQTTRRLFTPFFTTKPQGEGTGLGLAIAHRIVAGLGGEIEVETELGRGTTFRVVLPIARDTAAVASEAPPRDVRPGRRGRVLVVDDEAMVATALGRILAAEHDVQCVTRARDALERIRDGQSFDVILCDLMMPEMTGMELYTELEALGIADRIVFLTGGAFTASARQFLEQVPNVRIDKPFNSEDVLAVIRTRLA